jgi:glycosyltransferase involved in cell wall biosynthesis
MFGDLVQIKENICFTVGSFNGGGAESHVLSILSNIDRNKYHPIVVVLSDKGELAKRYYNLGIPVYSLDHKVYKYRSSINKLTKILKMNKTNIIHIHTVGTFDISLIAATLAKVRSKIITWHSVYLMNDVRASNLNQYLKIRLYVFRLKMGAHLSSFIVAVSKNVKEENCKSLNVSPQKVTVIYNGIEKRKVNTTRNDNSEFVIGAVGNLNPDKGYGYLIESMPQIIENIPEARMYIIGEGIERRYLEQSIADLNIRDRVLLLGYKENVYKYIKQYDLWIMPSEREGFSIAILEAMSIGSTIIATSVGGNIEAISHGVNGLIIPPRSSKSIAEAVIYLYNNPEMRVEFGEKAIKAFSQNYTIKNMIDELDKVYSGG